MQSYRSAVALVMMLISALALHANCGVERWPVKIAADADVQEISLLAMPVSIATLRAIPAPRPLPHERRLAPLEMTKYSVTATLIAYRLAPDDSIQMVLADDAGRTIVAQIPSAACVTGSSFALQIEDARRHFDTKFPGATEVDQQESVSVEVQGFGFFDFLQGQRGLAPNGVSLAPVVGIHFPPSIRPIPPPASSRRRAVRPPETCVLPSLTIAASQVSACAGEALTVSWQSSSPSSTVSIDGIGTALPPLGSRTLTMAATSLFVGRAENACGMGFESVALTKLRPASMAGLSGPAGVRQGLTGTLSISLDGPERWTIASSLGNPITPQSGTVGGAALYQAIHTGDDNVTLIATGGACGTVTRTIAITALPPKPLTPKPPPPPPPPPPVGIKCCDGTLSTQCSSCSSLQGCCSGHKGVCDCGNNSADGENVPCGVN